MKLWWGYRDVLFPGKGEVLYGKRERDRQQEGRVCRYEFSSSYLFYDLEFPLIDNRVL